LLIALVFHQDNTLRTLWLAYPVQEPVHHPEYSCHYGGLAIVSIQLIVIYIIAQKKLVEGLFSGSSKSDAL